MLGNDGAEAKKVHERVSKKEKAMQGGGSEEGRQTDRHRREKTNRQTLKKKGN